MTLPNFPRFPSPFKAQTYKHTQLEALRESKTHWERNHNLGLDGAYIGPRYCKCCENYFDYGICTVCPIREFTGTTGCNRTPYELAEKAADGQDYKLFNEAAEMEVKFLGALINGDFVSAYYSCQWAEEALKELDNAEDT